MCVGTHTSCNTAVRPKQTVLVLKVQAFCLRQLVVVSITSSNTRSSHHTSPAGHNIEPSLVHCEQLVLLRLHQSIHGSETSHVTVMVSVWKTIRRLYGLFDPRSLFSGATVQWIVSKLYTYIHRDFMQSAMARKHVKIFQQNTCTGLRTRVSAFQTRKFYTRTKVISACPRKIQGEVILINRESFVCYRSF